MKTMKNECNEYADRIVEEINAVVRHESEEYDGLLEWLNNQLDIEYTVNGRGEYVGAKVYITLGGPTAYYETRNGKVTVNWGTESGEAWVCEAAESELDELLADDWDIIRGC